jgi:hypothetical protein
MVQVKPPIQKPILVSKSAGRGYRIRYLIRYRIRYPNLTSYISYDIVCDVSNVISYTMSYTMSYLNLRFQIRYSATYDIVGHIVGQNTVLGNRAYDIVSHIVYDIVCQTHDIVYDFVFSYYIVGGRTVLANRRLRRRIRHRRFSYDVVYDVVPLCQVDTMSYTTTDAMSSRYDVEFSKRYDHTTS